MGRLITSDGSYVTTADGAYIRAYPRGTNGSSLTATAVAVLPYEDEVDTRRSATELVEIPSCAGGGRNPAWWAVTVPAGVKRLKASIFKGTFYVGTLAVLAAWRGSPGSLTQIGCSADGIGPLKVDVDPGEVIYFQVVALSAAAPAYYVGHRKVAIRIEAGQAALENQGQIQLVWVEITKRLPSEE